MIESEKSLALELDLVDLVVVVVVATVVVVAENVRDLLEPSVHESLLGLFALTYYVAAK